MVPTAERLEALRHMAVKERRARWWRPVWAGAALAVVLVATVLLIGTWIMARGEPAWWSALDQSAPDAPARAESLEQGVVSALHRARPRGETWTVEIKDRDASAWLVHRFPRWLANRGRPLPQGLRQVRIGFGDGEILVGAGVGRELGGWFGPSVLALRVRPVLDESGAITLRDATLEVGIIALPNAAKPGGLRDWIPDSAIDEDSRRLIEAVLSGEAPALEQATIRLEDGRVVRLVAIDLAPGRARLTCVSE